jgi:LysM repeat protein
MANKFLPGSMGALPGGQTAGTARDVPDKKRPENFKKGKFGKELPEIPDKYKVKKGDTLSQIAEKFKTSLKELLRSNKDIKDPNMISIGQSIIIPKKRGVPVYSDLKGSEWSKIRGGVNPYMGRSKHGGTVKRKYGSKVKRKSGGKIVTDGNIYVANLYKGGKVGG